MSIDVTDDAGRRYVTIDRPEARNALTVEMAAALADTIESSDPAEHDAIVLEGAGGTFSAGGDVRAMGERADDVRAEYESIAATFGRIVEACITSPVPIVSVVRGDAIGAGLSLVAASDLAYAADSARFSLAFVRMGLVPDTGASVLVPHLIGLRQTMRLALTGEFVDAPEAASMGLVTAAVPEADLEETVETTLSALQAVPTRTAGLVKETIYGGLGRDWRTALEHENQVQAQARETPEHDAAVRAFVDRHGGADR